MQAARTQATCEQAIVVAVRNRKFHGRGHARSYAFFSGLDALNISSIRSVTT